ncbi:MAG: choice-of-anchor D domain-containing protein [Gemmatimonadota bacterium]
MSTTPIMATAVGRSRALVLAVAGLVCLAVAGRVTAAVNAWEYRGPAQVVNRLVPDPTATGRIYAAGADGLYRSEDGGRTWSGAALWLAGRNVLSLAVDPEDGDRLYAGTSTGLFVSDSGGGAWSAVATAGSGILSLATGPESHGLVYAGTLGRGVYASDDGGATWRQSGLLEAGIIYDLATTRLSARMVYAGTADGLFASTDGGQKWSRVGQELAGKSVRRVYLSPVLEEPGLIVVGTYGSGVYRSLDGGRTWTTINTGLQPLQVRDLAVLDSTFAGTIYAATSTGGFYRTKDGGQHWLPINAGLPSLTSRSLLTVPGDKDLLLGTGPGNGVWEIRFASEPQIRVTPTAVDFGPVPVTTTQARVVTIANVGTADLIVTGASLSAATGFSVAFSGPVAVAPGQSLELEVRFTPAVYDLPLRDRLTVASSDPDEPVTRVDLSGTGTRAVLSATPGEIAFGAVRLPPGYADTTLVLRNSGSARLTLFSAAVDNSRFQIQGFTSRVLEPGQSLALRISFQPLLPRSEAAILRVVSDSTPDTLKLRLTGTGAAPDIRTSVTYLDFGRVEIGAARSLPVTITNPGSAPLAVTQVRTGTGQFSLSQGLPGRDTTLVVTRPETLKVVAGGDTALAFAAGDSTRIIIGAGATLILSGGDTTLIRTAGDTTVVVVGHQVTAFAPGPDTTFVAPGASQELQVAFHPAVAEPQVDTLSIVSDAPLGFGLTQVVLRGEGNALALEPLAPIAIGTRPVGLAVADLDGTPGLDLAVTDSASGLLYVLLNEGAGVFPAERRRTYPGVGTAYNRWVEPVTVAAASIYGGPRPDLVVGDRAARSISILRNDGLGGFAGPRADLFIGHQLTDLTTADLDGDGDQDIAVANGPGSATVTLLYNDGRGNFESRAVIAVQADPVAIAAGHLNPDGYSDLVVANRGGNSVSVLVNDRLGSFPVRRHLPAGVGPVAAVLSDLDADGDPDLVVANGGTQNLGVYANDGEGRFTAVGVLAAGMRPWALALGALSADMYNDIVVGGSAAVLSVQENQNGADFKAEEVATGFQVRQVRVADLDGNRVSDVVVVSSQGASLQVYRNTLAQRQMRPQPPVRVAAADVPRDLGGRILVTWEDGDYGTVPPASQVIQTTGYQVVRSETAGFAAADTLGTVPGGVFQYLDQNAAPYRTYYYQVRARRDALVSAPSAAAMAVSLPAPLVDLRVANGPRVSVGDTLVLRAYVTPAHVDLAGLSLFVTYQTAALRLLADSTGGASRPFRVALPGLTAALNAVHDTSAPGKLDLSLIAPPGASALAAGVEPVLVAEAWFQALRDTTTLLTVDDDPAHNRTTAVVQDGTGNWLMPVLGDTIRVSLRNYQVRGALRLESRSPAPGDVQATLLFVGPGGDTLQSPLNDEDRFRPGIQITLDPGGQFQLAQIPRGSYRVFAKAATHLQGRLVGDTVAIDTTGKYLHFKWVPPTGGAFASREDSTLLPAGDANDDNRINLADFGLLVKHFGANASSASWAEARGADFDGQDGVGLDDFWLLADNFGRVGMQAAATGRPIAEGVPLVLDRAAGTLTVRGTRGLTGFALRGDPGLEVELGGTIWEGRPLLVQRWTRGGVTQVAAALTDPAQAFSGDGVLVRLRGEGQVASAELLDGSGAALAAALVTGLPLRAELGANYPNPFNPATTIPFAVPTGPGGEAASVRLEVYDLLGQRVRVLVDEALPAGPHQVVWDGRDSRGAAVASGTYFYRLEIGPFEQARRLLLVR